MVKACSAKRPADHFVLPAFAVFLGLTMYALWRRARQREEELHEYGV